MRKKPKASFPEQGFESGVTLVELLIAMVVLMVGVGGLIATFTSGMATSNVQGQTATRTTVYAENKMEELLRLSYTDTTSNTTVFPPALNGGTGLAAGGGITWGTQVPMYVDYLDSAGALSTAPGSYTRQWQIVDNAPIGSPLAAHSKTITVAVYGQSLTPAGGQATTKLVCVKSDLTW